MALYLVQHGKSLPKDEDPEQGLSPEGLSDVNRIASVAKSYGIKPAAIRHSGKKRARQTAEIFGQMLLPEGNIEQAPGLNPLDDVSLVAAQLRSSDSLMLVGHLPFMERLTNLLLTGSIEKLVFKFQNGGIVCLDQESDSPWWFIKWTLMPRIA
jgi:phosphohistidine phosphatase